MKQKSFYTCDSCGHRTPKWVGQCPQCGEWNTLVETVPMAIRIAPGASTPQPLSGISSQQSLRLASGVGEFDRVLGGGLVPGSVILLAGEPGVGKSTLLLQIASNVGRGSAPGADFGAGSVLYVAGEESPSQIKLRSERLGIAGDNIQVLAETDIDTILNYPFSKLHLLIVDSIQSLTTSDLQSAPGSVAQVRECAARLVRQVKSTQIPVILVGQITKGGGVAGPKTLEHLVDAVCYLEGDQFRGFRLLRAAKNRFGSTQEAGVFQMGAAGLEEVPNPAAIFLDDPPHPGDQRGGVVTIVLEGTRPLLLEVQALTSKTVFGYPRRTASGFDYNRLLMIIAALERHGGISLREEDVYVNVVGGFKLKSPAADLATALALASSFRGAPLGQEVVAFGEVGLGGEVRDVTQMERCLREVEKLGFKKIIYPGNTRTLAEALKKAL